MLMSYHWMIRFGGLMATVGAIGMFVCLLVLLFAGGGAGFGTLSFLLRLCAATGLSCATFIGGILFLVHGFDRPDSDV